MEEDGVEETQLYDRDVEVYEARCGTNQIKDSLGLFIYFFTHPLGLVFLLL